MPPFLLAALPPPPPPHLDLDALVKVDVVLPAVLRLVGVGEARVKGHRLDVLGLQRLGAGVKVLGHGERRAGWRKEAGERACVGARENGLDRGREKPRSAAEAKTSKQGWSAGRTKGQSGAAAVRTRLSAA